MTNDKKQPIELKCLKAKNNIVKKKQKTSENMARKQCESNWAALIQPIDI